MSEWSGHVKADLPFPIVARFEHFCEGCTDVDLTARMEKVYGNGTPTEITIGVVSCNNLDSCQRLVEHFKRATNEIH